MATFRYTSYSRPHIKGSWPPISLQSICLLTVICNYNLTNTRIPSLLVYMAIAPIILISWSRLYWYFVQQCFVQKWNPLLGAQTCYCPVSIEELSSFTAYNHQQIHQWSSSCSHCVFRIIWPSSFDKPSFWFWFWFWFWFCSFSNFSGIFSSDLTAYIQQNNCPTPCLFLSYI